MHLSCCDRLSQCMSVFLAIAPQKDNMPSSNLTAVVITLWGKRTFYLIIYMTVRFIALYHTNIAHNNLIPAETVISATPSDEILQILHYGQMTDK